MLGSTHGQLRSPAQAGGRDRGKQRSAAGFAARAVSGRVRACFAHACFSFFTWPKIERKSFLVLGIFYSFPRFLVSLGLPLPSCHLLFLCNLLLSSSCPLWCSATLTWCRIPTRNPHAALTDHTSGLWQGSEGLQWGDSHWWFRHLSVPVVGSAWSCPEQLG